MAIGHGQFGGICFAPQVPPAPAPRCCTPVVISTKLTSRLSLAPCCAGQPSFGHIQAAPRRALLLLLHPQEVKPSKNSGSERPSAFELAQKAFEARGMHSHEEGPATR
jgi:hypothetical protein